jgi:hypothetical protein
MEALQAAMSAAENPYLDDEGYFHLGPDLYRWRALRAEHETAKVAYQLKVKEIDEFLLKSPTYQQLELARVQAKAEAARAGQAYNDLVAELSEKTGLDLRGCSIREETGRISILDEKGRPQPARKNDHEPHAAGPEPSEPQ